MMVLVVLEMLVVHGGWFVGLWVADGWVDGGGSW